VETNRSLPDGRGSLMSFQREGLLVLFLIFSMLTFGSAHSYGDNPGWHSVPLCTASQKAANLPGGEGFQYVHAIAYAPSNPSVIYLSTDTSQVWKSTDGGYRWHPTNRGFVAHGARSLIVDPKNPEVVFAAGFLGVNFHEAEKYKKRLQGIYRTTDGGKHWSLVKATDFYKQESKGSLFAFDSSRCASNRTSVVFAGSYSEGLLRSEDGGNTWRVVGFQGQHIIDMKEISDRPGELFIATEDGLYRYYNGSRESIGKGLPGWPRSIAISPQNPQVVYAAVGREGVFKSTDGGRNFVSISTGLPWNTNYTDIAVSPVNSDIIYVKAHLSGLNPLFSHDGGKRWHISKSTDLEKIIEDKSGFWFSSPFAAHPTEVMTALTASNGRARIVKTRDGGKNWTYSGSGFTGGRMMDIAFSKDGKMVFCLTDHGLWLTEDGGETFRELKTKRILGLKSSRSADIRGSTIVASLGAWGDKGLAVSDDLGKTWKYFDKLIDFFHFIGIHPEDENIIYAGPYLSKDKGKTWSKLSQTVRAMYSKNGDIVYSLSPEGERKCSILKSIDQGRSWLNPYPVCPISAEAVRDVALAPDDPDRVYLATSNGVWILDGKKWMKRDSNHGLQKDFFGLCSINSVSVDPNNPNIVYAGRWAPGCGQSNGIFRSTDRGLTWKNITNNLGPALTVWSIQIDPLDSTVYIGTSLGTFAE